MSVVEMLVLGGGLVLGYVVVSRLYDEMFGDRLRGDSKAGVNEKRSDGGGTRSK
jgi:hypothetical protein